MTKTLLAAIGGLTFGLVLATSVYNFRSHACCRRTTSVQAVRITMPPPPAPSVPPCRRASAVHVITITDNDDLPILSFDKMPADQRKDFDVLADKTLAQARAVAKKNPRQARDLCRKVMKLYDNNPRVDRVHIAFKLMNTIISTYGIDEDDDE